MSERLKDFEEAIDQMIHNYQSMVDPENRSKTELYAKNYVDYREFIVEAYKKALSRIYESLTDRHVNITKEILEEYQEENERLEQQNKRYREALSIISANLPLDGREHYVDIARKALEGDE